MPPSKNGRWPDTVGSSQSQLAGHEPYTIGQGTLSVTEGNLVDCPTEALVCYASSSLALHSMIAAKLVEIGGTIIRNDSAKHIPSQIGSAIVLTAGKLPARYVIVGITNHIKSAPTIAHIRASVQAVLQQAAQLGLRSLALPTIRVSKQISPDDALLATLAPIVDHLSGPTSIEHIALVIDDSDDFPLLSNYLSISLNRLQQAAKLRAPLLALQTSERHLLESKTLLQSAELWQNDSLLEQLYQKQLELNQELLSILMAQQDEQQSRWQASHNVEIELVHEQIARLQSLLAPSQERQISA
jgi:O-acetyl-ADP-ribose deacetylase (regulator of RNase III)